MKRKALVTAFFLFALVFFGIHFVNADYITGATATSTYSIISTSGDACGNIDYQAEVFQANLSSATTTITSLDFTVENPAGDYAYIYGGYTNAADAAANWTYDCTNGLRQNGGYMTQVTRFNLDYSITDTPDNMTGLTPSGGTKTLENGKYYVLMFVPNLGNPGRNGHPIYVYGSSVSTGNDVFRIPTSGSSTGSLNGLKTWYYRLGISGSLAPSDYISITVPTASTTQDFDTWAVEYNAVISTSSAPAVQIQYYNNNSSSTLYYDYDSFGCTSSCTVPIPKSTFLDLGTWTATAYLEEVPAGGAQGSWGVIASSTPVTFTIVTPYQFPTSTIPVPVSTSTSLSLTCDQSSGAFAYSLCNLFQFLFVPSSQALQNFNNLQTLITSKPPIGYFTAVKNVLSEATTSASSSLSFPSLEFASSTVFNPLRSGINWILWVLFGFWAFHRFRKFSL